MSALPPPSICASHHNQCVVIIVLNKHLQLPESINETIIAIRLRSAIINNKRSPVSALHRLIRLNDGP